MTTERLSIRAYARRRGVDEKAIRKRIEDGTLAKALDRDGRIDPAKADRLLADSQTGGKRAPSRLVDARRRKAAASLALLRDEVDELVRTSPPVKDAAELLKRVRQRIADCLGTIASKASAVAGQDPGTVSRILETAVHDALLAISETKVAAAKCKRAKPAPPRNLAAMTLVELAAERQDLQARRLEIVRGRRTGQLIELAPWEADLMTRVLTMKRIVTDMPMKLAPLLGSATAAKARALIDREVAAALAMLSDKRRAS